MSLMASHGEIKSHECSNNNEECCSSNESCVTQSVVVVVNNNNVNVKERLSVSSSSSCLSVCSVEVDLENGGGKMNVEEYLMNNKEEEIKDCRICHLSLDGSNSESGFPIELGCSCKEDLSLAHKHCAEAWFKIRGNKTCEICGSTAQNVVGVNEVELVEQWNEVNETAATTAAPPHPSETRHFWQGHRFLNFLLACMVFAFVISWLFHFNVPS